MNERIRLFTEQAEKYADDNFKGQPTYSDAYDTKFAELIVAKMLQTCEDHPGWSGRMIGEEIKQHFRS
jgi:hypothetical protein